MDVRAQELEVCLRVLRELAAAELDDPRRVVVERAVDAFNKSLKRKRRTARRSAARARDGELTARTATGGRERVEDAALVSGAVAGAGPVGVLHRQRRCYICKEHYRELDGMYHQMCPPCAALNRERRTAGADLTGRRALVTGGRVKIGFELVLKLLRDGAEVAVTTRFPRDAERRFAAVPDSGRWWHRLSVVAVDLRDVGAVAEWCGRLRDAGRPLDILVNNAAQTIRRPAAAYAELAAGELVGGELVGGVVGGVVGDVRAAGVAAGPVVRALEASTGRDGAPVVGVSVPAARALATTGLLPDHSAQNSWTRRVHEVDPVELLEVQLVNVTAPFLLVGQLRPVLAEGARRASSGRAYVVNVSAVEGQFDRRYKAPGHPHTNMAKAALNMLTRTSAEDLAAEGVLMTSVDTGWITDEKPHPQKERMAAAGFRTPLDVVDGAARIYDPIVRGEGPDGGEAVYGCFLKDYRSAAW